MKYVFDIQWQILKYIINLICPATGKILKVPFNVISLTMKGITVVCIALKFSIKLYKHWPNKYVFNEEIVNLTTHYSRFV